MPLLLVSKPFPDASFGLWHIEEEEAYFRADLPLSAAEEQEFARHQNPLRRLEWLAGRWLLHKLTDEPERLPLAKDAFSKPFFPDNQHLGCSLSHSKGIIGALVVNSGSAPEVPHAIGCDIQVKTEKMARLAYKFLNEPEQEFVAQFPAIEHLELFHLYWTAKESLYKAYGLKELDFRKNIQVGPIQWDGFRGEGIGFIEKGVYRQRFQLIYGKYELSDGNPLLYAIALGGA
ncbi:MAG: 4'-phosphopantetheinyl transferase superfamily protein [Saprospiraceae bacterium]|nr:4'-phosphopantetheinyl transferase superfamily protein [Saprospiraceae bacterium]